MNYETFAAGFATCLLLVGMIHALLWLKRNPAPPALEPRPGYTVVTRADGSQHYRRLVQREATGEHIEITQLPDAAQP